MEKFNTSHDACRMLVDLLVENGVENVVISPGSRNAPLIIAFSRCEKIDKRIIVDERAASYVALGMCQQLQKPVAIVCTSGTALLNYAPAVAEAYYQNLPLVVISADRPLEWIDQDDSQTIRQNGALSNFIKNTYNIPARYDEELKWYINRLFNEALLCAINGTKGPVHINMELKEPLCNLVPDINEPISVVKKAPIKSQLDTDFADSLAKKIANHKKVMIIGGFYPPDEKLNECISKLSEFDNIIVLTETVSNLNGKNFIDCIDRTISSIKREENSSFMPELVISFGGSLVSRIVKQKIRDSENVECWSVGENEKVIDVFQSLTMKIELDPTSFFEQICNCIKSKKIVESNYSIIWQNKKQLATTTHKEYIKNAPWCDLKAFSCILPYIPESYNLQFSNGTSIRYSQLFGDYHKNRCNCNRGVSGIDGCTSTALGASLVSSNPTLLITGDMSFSYDLGGLNTQYNHQNFKIIVMNNGGGGIFRFIKGPSDLEELEDYFEVTKYISIDKYAAAFGFAYFEANNEEELKRIFDKFLNYKNSSAILSIKTPNDVNAKILRGYFRRDK